MGAKNIVFIADVEERTIIHADEEMLRIVLNNLPANAVKFTEPGDTTKLTRTFGADKVTITIEDNGPGMNEETKKHLFDKFLQGESSHSKKGNGLGLVPSLKVIEWMDIHVELIRSRDSIYDCFKNKKE